MNKQAEGMEIIQSTNSEPVRLSSGLLKRGLIDLANRHVSMEQIRQARSENQIFQDLTDTAIEIALEQPALWYYRLFFQVLSDQVLKYKNLHYEEAATVISRTDVFVDRSNVGQWSSEYMEEALSIIDTPTNKI